MRQRPSSATCQRDPASLSPRVILAACAMVVSAATQPSAALCSYPVGDSPQAVAIGDLDRDHRQDIVTANHSSGGVTVLLNRGGARFDREDLATGEWCHHLAIADLNGDAAPDLVAASLSVCVFLGNGDGTFQPRADYALSGGAACVAAADLNGDGVQDIVAGDGDWTGQVVVFLGDGDGTFGAPGYFPANPLSPWTRPAGPTAGPFRSDHASPPVAPLKVAQIWSVAIGDMDGDRLPDIAVGMEGLSGILQVLHGNGDGTFGWGPANFETSSYRSLTMADFNRDGWLDLASASPGNLAVSVILNRGDGSLGPLSYQPSRSYPIGLAVGDLNRDGLVDMVSPDYYPDEVCVWLGNGVGGFGAPAYFETDELAYSVAIGDLDGDGRADLATANDSSCTVSVLFGDGEGGFGAAPIVGVPAELRPIALMLGPVHPNPVSFQATIRFTLPNAGLASVRILDGAGRLVATLQDGLLPAGEHAARWDRRDSDGSTVPPGVYSCELRFGGVTRCRRIAVLR